MSKNVLRFLWHGAYHVVVRGGSHFCQSPQSGGVRSFLIKTWGRANTFFWKKYQNSSALPPPPRRNVPSLIVYSLERKGATRTFAERNTAYPRDKRSGIACRVIYCTVFSLSGRNLISVRNKLPLLSVLSKTVPMWFMLRHRSLSRFQEMRWRLLHPPWKEPKASLKRVPRPRAG